MAIYVANVNGDWWEYHSSHPLFVLDTDELSEADLAIIGDEIGEDKFENLIMQYGREVLLDV
jgi:hypothetical protein